MRLRIFSDLHLEFSDFNVPDLEGDKDTVLVLAGDIGLVHKPRNLNEVYLPFLSRCNIQFRKVILICGNHEHYGGSFRRTVADLRGAVASKNLENVVILEKETYVIDDVAFIGATFWTNCDGGHPMAMYLFQGMSDNRVIRTGPNASLPYERKFSAADSRTDHMYAKQYIVNAIKEQKQLGHKTVVVIHHGPTKKSIHPMYEGSDMNMFYASELTETWIDTNPDLIIHGHTHHPMDYFVDDEKVTCQTRVLCNPRGYAGHEPDWGFNPTLVYDV